MELQVPDLLKRILSAIIAAPVFLYMTWLGGWIFFATLLVLTVIIQLEIVRLIKRQDMEVQKIMSLILGVPVLAIPLFPEKAWILFLLLLLMTMLIETFSASRNSWKRLMATILVAVLIPALFSGLLFLRNFIDDSTGFIITFTLLLMVWSNDVFAFFGGKTFGRHQLAPTISPSKTIEGFIFGFLGCFVALIFCHSLIPDYPLQWSVSLPFAIFTGLFGPAGDLIESKLKRSSGIKDSSDLMPGHGGLYDRLDALLFSAPAAAVYFFILDAAHVL